MQKLKEKKDSLIHIKQEQCMMASGKVDLEMEKDQ